jgi:hypothetical protein
MATPDMIYLTVLSKCRATTAASEDGIWKNLTLKEGECFRGWIVGQVKGKIVFLTGGADYYRLPAKSAQLTMRGDNPILEGRVSPR